MCTCVRIHAYILPPPLARKPTFNHALLKALKAFILLTITGPLPTSRNNACVTLPGILTVSCLLASVFLATA